MSDIENELRHYKEHFRDKTVFCNCDDPFESNFFKYFAINFNFLGLKKLICTCYAGSPVSHTELNDLPLFRKDEKLPYKIEITDVPDLNGDGAVDLSDIELLLKSNENNLTILDGDGDFRSEECIELLNESDVVVTNPPFSLFREYVTQLMKYDKKFVIIGGMNAITYKEIFPLIKDNRMWLGYGFKGGNAFFETAKTEGYANGVYDEKTNLVKFRNCVWYTNLDIEKRHEELDLYQHYSPEKYPKYDNYDAINVDRVADIPCDYYEDIGAPITYLEKHNPEQFELVKFRKGDDGKDLTYTDLASKQASKQAKASKQADYSVLQNHHQKEESVTASWESQSHSLINTIRNSSRLLASQIVQDGLAVSRASLLSREEKSITESSSRERCNGIMGVPITFLDKYNPNQFELVGCSYDYGRPDGWPKSINMSPTIKGKNIYKRLFIKRRTHENRASKNQS